MSNPILRWFDSSHLKNEAVKEVVKEYKSMAITLDQFLGKGPEKSTALRKLLESKDAAVRQIILDEEPKPPVSDGHTTSPLGFPDR